MIDPYSRSFYPPNLHEFGIVCSNNHGMVVNIPKPLDYCVKHGFRIGYWKLKADDNKTSGHKKYYTGFINVRNAKFHLFEEKTGTKSLCGQTKVKNSGWCQLQKTITGFLFHLPTSEYPVPKTYVGDYCTNCINKMK